VLVADGAADSTLDVAELFPNVCARHFAERVQVGDTWMNPEPAHVNFLIDWAIAEGADWIIFDDCDCWPNPALKRDGRHILEETDAPGVHLYRLYLWGKDEYMPKFNVSDTIWAWRPALQTVHWPETSHFNFASQVQGINPGSALHLDAPPYCCLHHFAPDEAARCRRSWTGMRSGASPRCTAEIRIRAACAVAEMGDEQCCRVTSSTATIRAKTRTMTRCRPCALTLPKARRASGKLSYDQHLGQGWLARRLGAWPARRGVVEVLLCRRRLDAGHPHAGRRISHPVPPFAISAWNAARVLPQPRLPICPRRAARVVAIAHPEMMLPKATEYLYRGCVEHLDDAHYYSINEAEPEGQWYWVSLKPYFLDGELYKLLDTVDYTDWDNITSLPAFLTVAGSVATPTPTTWREEYPWWFVEAARRSCPVWAELPIATGICIIDMWLLNYRRVRGIVDVVLPTAMPAPAADDGRRAQGENRIVRVKVQPLA
jgi:hypothetical protein